MATNRRLVDFDGADFYPTPTYGTLALLNQEEFSGSVLEPCCGDGAISKVFAERNFRVSSFDKFDRGYGEVRDAFMITEGYDNVITNPPFAIAEDLIHHFSDKFRKKMCMLLRTAFLESAGRYERLFSRFPPSRVHVFSERLSMYPAGQQGVRGGGTTSYSWFVWDTATQKVDGPRIRWIPPGLKPKSRRARAAPKPLRTAHEMQAMLGDRKNHPLPD